MTRIWTALLSLVALAGCMAGHAMQADTAQWVGTYDWPASDHGLGGFSGLDMSGDSSSLTAVTDRGTLVTARIVRTGRRISGLDIVDTNVLVDRKGAPLRHPRTDAEGLARADDGTLYVSFEGIHRVTSYAVMSRAGALPQVPGFRDMPPNSGLEALAIDPQGRLLAIPERSGQITRPFPVWRLQGGRWSESFSISRSGGFLPVGADVGPDNALYVLERGFTGFGFVSRVRRFALDQPGLQSGETLFRTRLWTHDNLEGLSVWRDGNGAIRLTMISDDNFRSIQRTQLVEYAVPGS